MGERFNNPFIDHALLSIALNSTSKWKARCLPSLKGYVEKFGKLPRRLAFSLAAYIAFYTSNVQRLEADALICKRGDQEYAVKDDRPVLEFYFAHKDDAPADLAKAVLSNEAFWGRGSDEDLRPRGRGRRVSRRCA